MLREGKLDEGLCEQHGADSKCSVRPQPAAHMQQALNLNQARLQEKEKENHQHVLLRGTRGEERQNVHERRSQKRCRCGDNAVVGVFDGAIHGKV